MKLTWISECGFITSAFFCDDVENDGFILGFQVFKGTDEKR